MTNINEVKTIKVAAGHYTVGHYTVKHTEHDGWAIWDVLETEETGVLDIAGMFDSSNTLLGAVQLVHTYLNRELLQSAEEEDADSLEDMLSTVYGKGRIYYNQLVAKYTYSRPGSNAHIIRNICKGKRKYSVESIARKSNSSINRVLDLLSWLQKKEGFCIEVVDGVVTPAGLTN